MREINFFTYEYLRRAIENLQKDETKSLLCFVDERIVRHIFGLEYWAATRNINVSRSQYTGTFIIWIEYRNMYDIKIELLILF